MTRRAEAFWELLPAYVRFRDFYEGEPLRALMAVLETQYRALEEDIEGLYDDWFIETCQERIAPFLGDLLGVRGLEDPSSWVPGQRTRIANVLAYRQHKGTAAALARAARDVTGWRCRAVPFFELLSVTQSAQHPRRERGRLVDVRDGDALARLGGPFERIAHRPQVSGGGARQPLSAPREGYNLPHLGLFLWRLESFPVRGRTARRLAPGCYTFHPLGIDQPLFGRPESPDPLPGPTTELHVGGPLSRRILAAELAARRRGEVPVTDYFGDRPALEILDPTTRRPVPWRSIAIADLSDWRRPAPSRSRRPGQPGLPGSRRGEPDEPIVVAVDPELGRLAFALDQPASDEVRVACCYGFGADLGGGPYERSPASEELGAGDRLGVGVATAARGPDPAPEFGSLQDALDRWPQGSKTGVIQIGDSATYGGWAGLSLEIRLRPGATLAIEAERGAAPAFIGDLRVLVESDEKADQGAKAARLILDGLQIGGKIVVAAAGDEPGPRALDLDLRHSTVRAPDGAGAGSPAPAETSLELERAAGADWKIAARIESSILGAIRLPADCGRVVARDSILDAGRGWAITGGDGGESGAAVELDACTVFGRVTVARLSAEDTIFTERVEVAARHLGRVRSSYVPAGSATPRRERCQPDGKPLRPSFTSRTHGQPGYGQLDRSCPPEIRAGAADGSEMGAFRGQRNPFREANLAGILDEYLPWGLEPRIFYPT